MGKNVQFLKFSEMETKDLIPNAKVRMVHTRRQNLPKSQQIRKYRQIEISNRNAYLDHGSSGTRL